MKFLAVAILLSAGAAAMGSPPAAYSAALESAGRGDWPAARRALEQVIEQQPRWGPAYRKLGQLAVSFNVTSEATAYFTALATRPATGGNLGLAWLAFDRRDWGEAWRLSNLAVQATPLDFAAPFLLWNVAAVRNGKSAEVEAFYRAWLQREPDAMIARFGWHHLTVWAGRSTTADLDRMRQLHGGQRDLLEAWFLSEFQAAPRERAWTALRDAAALTQTSGDAELAFLIAHYSVTVLSDKGLLREAAIAADQAQAAALRLGDKPRALFLGAQGCRLRLDLGDPSAGVICRAAADGALAAPGNETTASHALTRLATIEAGSGHYDIALRHLEQALDLGLRSGFPIVGAIRRRDLAILLLSLGQPAQADPLLRETLRVASVNDGQWQTRAQTLATLGRCAALRGQAIEATQHFEAALAIATQKGDKESEGLIWRERAMAAAATGDLRAAAGALDEAIGRAEQAGQFYQLPPLLTAAGHTRIRLGQTAAAAPLLERALAVGREVGRHDVEWEAYGGLGQIAERGGQRDTALGHYRRAIEASEEQRFHVPDPWWRGAFFASRQEVYQRAIGLLAATEQALEAFQLLERSRARALLDLGSAPTVSGSAPMDARSLALAQAVSTAEQRLLASTWSGRPAAELNPLRRQSEAAATEYQLHLSRQRRAAIFAGEEPAPVAEIQKQLAPGTAVLAYSLGPSRGWLLVATREQVKAFALPARESLAGRIGEAARLLARPPARTSLMRMQRLLHSLYQDLVAPAEPLLRRCPRWLVTAEGPLQSIPLGALVERASLEPNAFLVRRANISLIPSASVWLRQKTTGRVPAAQRLLVLAVADSQPAGGTLPLGVRGAAFGPLPGARSEAQLLAKLYGAEGTAIRVGEEATETETVRLLERARVAHLAVHGYADAARPLSSALILTVSSPANGLLQAYEIQQLSLAGLEVAVLPACSTMVGPDVPGEGVQALAAAFLMAGARNVVGSLWPVADASTADVMLEFHTRLRSGESVSEALRHAQMAALRRPARRHPYYWAGFQAVGAGE